MDVLRRKATERLNQGFTGLRLCRVQASGLALLQVSCDASFKSRSLGLAILEPALRCQGRFLLLVEAVASLLHAWSPPISNS